MVAEVTKKGMAILYDLAFGEWPVRRSVVLVLAIPFAFVSESWCAPVAAVWLDKIETRYPRDPVAAKDEDLKCLASGLCVGDKRPRRLII